jgi:hypothetical protein
MYETPIADLALTHILESGLKLVRNEPLDDQRRGAVLPALVQIFQEANKGSQAVSARNMLVGVTEAPTLERYALFFRYLDGSLGADLTDRLSEATGVLSAIQQNGPLDNDAKGRLAEMIENMLTAITREARVVQLAPPVEVRLSF